MGGAPVARTRLAECGMLMASPSCRVMMVAAVMNGAAIGAVLAAHLLFIAWVIGGALVTRGRRWLTGAHLASLAWGVAVELGPWPCPLTLLEQALETRAGVAGYQGSFLLHYLQLLVYPNLSLLWLVAGGLAVCGTNFGVYAWRGWTLRRFDWRGARAAALSGRRGHGGGGWAGA